MTIWQFLIGAALLYVLFRLLRNRTPPTAAAPARTSPKITVAHGDGDYDQGVHGESHYQDALRAIAGPPEAEGKRFECEAVIEPEPGNKYDPNACTVKIGDKLVGYLPRDDAELFAGWCHDRDSFGLRCKAVIDGGWDDGKTTGFYGVKLDIHIT